MPETSEALTMKELEAVRMDREGAQWLSSGLGLETAPISGPPSNRRIFPAAFDLIVEFEVSSEQVYTACYRSPTWPRGASGVTIGIGYDVGYATNALLHADFDGAIPLAMITAIEAAIGVTGPPAQALAARLHGCTGPSTFRGTPPSPCTAIR